MKLNGKLQGGGGFKQKNIPWREGMDIFWNNTLLKEKYFVVVIEHECTSLFHVKSTDTKLSTFPSLLLTTVSKNLLVY